MSEGRAITTLSAAPDRYIRNYAWARLTLRPRAIEHDWPARVQPGAARAAEPWLRKGWRVLI